MTKRTLRRKVIIREYDFNKIRDQALGEGYYADDTALYDRVSWTPINQETLEQLKIIEILKGKSSKISTIEWDLKMPAVLIAQLKDYLYSEQYYRWKVTVDEQGYLFVQSRKNAPKTRLGWGVFEKDLQCRI